MKEEMIKAAYAALNNAYAPYSHFCVGACVLTEDQRLFTGANVENASYGLSCCAERNALFSAISAGVKPKQILRLVLVSEQEKAISPCGACRQVMCELMQEDAEVIMVGTKQMITLRVKELLPLAFDKEDMQ